MTNEKAIEILKTIEILSYRDKKHKYFAKDVLEAQKVAIKALMQQLRDCKTCKHSDNGNCAGTEECHECMWESKYEQQPSEDCISREEAIRIAEQGQIQGYEWQFKKLCDLPSVTPQPRIGHWIDRFGGCECSECGCLEAGYSDYCPNCGAKMEEVEE